MFQRPIRAEIHNYPSSPLPAAATAAVSAYNYPLLNRDSLVLSSE